MIPRILDELIWYIYDSTSYYDIINSNPNGEIKTANLKLLFEVIINLLF